MLLWCDIETEGLGPEHRILEIGFILTDDVLREYVSWSSLVYPFGLNEKTCDPVALKMHQKSGLWEELTDIGQRNRWGHDLLEFRPENVQAAAIEWVSQNAGERPILAGSSVHFDKAKIDQFMPKLGALFHYRIIDVSTIKELARRWAPDMVWKDDAMKTHRPLDDLRASIAELKHYRDKGFINVNG